MSAITRYRDTARLPHVARLLSIGVVGRLAPAMEIIAIVLFVREQTGSYAIAGAVTASSTIGFALGAPVLGRAVDRFGAFPVLWPTAILHAVALGALILAGVGGLPTAALIVCAFTCGFATPPTGSLIRRVLGELVSERRDLLSTVFALDSLLVELAFIGGPALSAVLIAVASPQVALLVAAAITILSVGALTLTPVISRAPLTADERDAGTGAMRSPGMRTLVMGLAPLGASYGAFQVAIVAFSEHAGSRSSSPWLMALLSFGGALGVFAYGAYGNRVKTTYALIGGAVALVPFYALTLVATSVLQIAPLVVLAGFAFTPVFAIINQIVSDVAPRGALTEAYSWVFMAGLGGGSIGLTVGGALIEEGGWRAGVLLGVATAAVTVVVLIVRRSTLPADPPVETAYAAGGPGSTG